MIPIGEEARQRDLGPFLTFNLSVFSSQMTPMSKVVKYGDPGTLLMVSKYMIGEFDTIPYLNEVE
jgi:hypothetical protein